MIIFQYKFLYKVKKSNATKQQSKHSIHRGIYNNNKTYYYDKNVIGEIIGIVDESGNYVVKYEYTTYGTVDKTITSTNDVSLYNPFVYKGYYYDEKTGYFWLSSS